MRFTLAIAALLVSVASCDPDVSISPRPHRARRALDGPLPSVAITSPAPYTYLKVTPAAPLASVVVEFAVANWTFPAADHGVVFLADGVTELALTHSASPLTLQGLAPGQHTVVACLVVSGPGGWSLHDADPDAVGLQRACAAVVLKVSLVGCWPTVWAPAQGEYICDPAHPGTCCVDQNPCSVDNCSWQAGSNTYECRYGPVSGSCCQSDYDCAEPQRCYGVDNPNTVQDDALLHKCYECDYLAATANASCDDLDPCTVDACGADYLCEHDPIEGPGGAACCHADADCDDQDPCTIDRCEDVVDGRGYCGIHSYKDLSDAEITGYGYDPADFQGCCVPGKELLYCTDHQVIVDDVLQQDACWNLACIANKCRYGKDPNPLCCNTGFECEDCAEYDPTTGECLAANLCTLVICVDNECQFDWDPFHPSDMDCCQVDIDCDDGLPNTVDSCTNFLCDIDVDPLYCDLTANPPVDCPAHPSPCLAYECDSAIAHCRTKPIPGACCDDSDCATGDACSLDTCDPVSHTCAHEAIELIEGKKCCNVSTDCYDEKVCTTEACVSHQCRYGTVTVNPAECASGKCCNTNDDLNGNGSADDCEVAGSCMPWQCSSHCCVPKPNRATGECITALDCEDGDPATWNVCDSCACAMEAAVTCDPGAPVCDDQNPCTVDTCDGLAGTCRFEPKPNCCLDNSDCPIGESDPCVAAYRCIQSLHMCQATSYVDCCDDPECDEFDACTADFCVTGKCRHLRFDSWCCTSTADCDDGRECTDDACVDQKCEHTLLETAADGARCCQIDGACNDGDAGTQDMCINSKCANPAIPGYCFPDEQDSPMCDDDNPCTADWCVFGKCRHLDPNEVPVGAMPSGCCANGTLCDDGDPCTLDTCVNATCVATPIEGCMPVEPLPEAVEPEPDLPEPLPEPVAEAAPEPSEPAPEPAPEPTPEVGELSTDLVEPVAEPAPEVIDTSTSDLDPSICPASVPEGACLGTGIGYCAYGQACCCGVCRPVNQCYCVQGAWICVPTEACQAPDCDDGGAPDTTPAVDGTVTDVAGGEDSGLGTDSGSGCAWPSGRETSGWPFGLAVALAVLVTRRRLAR